MTNEDKSMLTTLFYNAEEYYHYKNNDMQPYAQYLDELVNNISDVEDETLKLNLTNWIYKNKVYKTININSITVPYNNYISLNVLYGLMIRECSRYEYNTQPTTLHIEYDPETHEDISLEYFNRIEQFSTVFTKKKLHLFKDVSFINELEQFFFQHNYEIIYEISEINDIKSGMSNIHVNITDENINSFEEFIKQALNASCNKMYITHKCNNTNNIDLYRYNLDEFIFKYNTISFSIISEDYIPGKDIYVDNDNVGLKLNNNILLHSRTLSLENIIYKLKIDLIEKQYLSENCLNCSEKVLCLLGASDERCSYKMF